MQQLADSGLVVRLQRHFGPQVVQVALHAGHRQGLALPNEGYAPRPLRQRAVHYGVLVTTGRKISVSSNLLFVNAIDWCPNKRTGGGPKWDEK